MAMVAGTTSSRDTTPMGPNRKPSSAAAKAPRAHTAMSTVQVTTYHGPPRISSWLNTMKAGIRYNPLANFQAWKLVSMGFDPAMAAPAKPASATGGVTLESWEYQNTTRWAIRSGMPNSVVRAGPTSTMSTM